MECPLFISGLTTDTYVFKAIFKFLLLLSCFVEYFYSVVPTTKILSITQTAVLYTQLILFDVVCFFLRSTAKLESESKQYGERTFHNAPVKKSILFLRMENTNIFLSFYKVKFFVLCFYWRIINEKCMKVKFLNWVTWRVNYLVLEFLRPVSLLP